MLKKLIILCSVFFFPFFAWTQTTSLYTVQLGTFVNPQKADFHLLHSLDYVYAEPVEGNFSKLFLGEFTNEFAAANALNLAKQRGFSGFVIPKVLTPKASVIVVQFTTIKRTQTEIDWANLKNAGKLYTILTDPQRIKILTGPFANMPIARQRVAEIQAMGYTDAFVKTIHPDLLHEVNDFEMGISKVESNLSAAVDIIFNEEIPSNYEATSPILTPKGAQNVKLNPMPEIRPLVKRTSALDIQKVLKLNKFFNGSLDGFYGKATQGGYNNFTQQNTTFKKYALLAQNTNSPETAPTNALQVSINESINYPERLNPINHPLANAYQAYWLMVNGGNLLEVNQLMNAAIKATFADKKIKNAPPFDFNANYSYEDLTQFFLHLRYLHAAPKNSNYAIPCWLFENHPEEVLAAFKTKSKFASFANTKISACENFDNWPSLKMMNTIIQDLQPGTFTKEQLERQETLTTARNFQYLFPEKLSKSQKKQTDEWLRTFWKQLESSGATYPVLGKNLVALQILFYQSQVLLEDYFMNKEFTPDAAEGMALSVLKTYVEVPLEVYGL